jgi:molybdate transport system ATP-binding protein
MAPKILIRLVDVNFTLNGQKVLSGISWQLREREHWAVLGPNGSGKSTFLKLVRGDIWPDPANRHSSLAWRPMGGTFGAGQRIYSLDSLEQQSPVGIREHIAMVSPEIQERYLQQDWTLSGETVIHTGFFGSDLLYQKLDRNQKRLADETIDSLQLHALRRKNVQAMSTGELRRVLIARALVSRPKILILDEFCDSLDAEARRQLLALVEQVARSGTQILYTTHRPDEIIPSISHVLMLERGRIWREGAVEECRPSLRQRGARQRRTGFQPVKAPRPELFAKDCAPPAKANACDFLLRITNADVFLNRQKVLRDINWQMNVDENWAVLGKNGSGKSTFLKLIFGDLQPALGGKIHRLTDSSRQSAWQSKQRIGYVSADLQANYREDITGEEVVASGFFSSLGLIVKPSRRQMAKAHELVRRFGLGDLAKKAMMQMSYGELRKLLLLRALVNDPQVLLLDEPFDGLDAATKEQLVRALGQIVRDGTRLIVVTHHPGDLPGWITHALRLQEGRIIAQGRIERRFNHVSTDRLI